MMINKEAAAGKSVAVTAEELREINKFAKLELKAEEVFTFSVLLCDNETDRDYERFTVEALETLKELFVGKTGISDHQWSAKEQMARIYRTEVVTDSLRSTSYGEQYTYLKAYAYMLRTERNADVIAEIEGGIKKEVSIGCSIASTTCSICGGEMGSAKCGHVRGREYDGEICCAILSDPTDAYEWSFVAVPAQRGAGVIKRFAGECGHEVTLAEFVGNSGKKSFGDEFKLLCYEAELGRRYLSELRADVVRLGLLTDCGLTAELLESTAAKMDENELLGFREAFGKRADAMLPPVTQLCAFKSETKFEPETEFII